MNILRKENKIVIKHSFLQLIVLFILPLILILSGFYLKSTQCYNYLYCVDPEYCYLFNGLNFSHLKHAFYIDHPGTPLQMFSALVIRIVHIVHNSNVPLDIDVFQNAELFIKIISTSLFTLAGVVLLILGLLVLSLTNNLSSAFFLQLTPFSSYTIISLMERILPEHFMIPLVLVLILTVIYFLNKNIDKSNIYKYVFLFSVMVGFGTAVKITFFPLFFIPLLLVPGLFNKLKYSFLAVIFFAIFAYPVFYRWVDFRNWIKILFMHSGQYGSGPANIIDKYTFLKNINTVISTETVFFVALSIIILTSIVYHIPYLKLKFKKDKYYNGLLGIMIAMIIVTLLVAKQYKNFYITPALLLVVPGLYLTLTIYQRRLKFLTKQFIIIPAIFLFLFFLYHDQLKLIFDYHGIRQEQKKNYLSSLGIEKKYSDKPVLMICDYTGGSYKEFALLWGILWIGGSDTKMHVRYASTLKNIYPNFYLYNSYDHLFNYWDNSFSYFCLLHKYKNFYVYSRDEEVTQTLWTKFYGLNRQAESTDTILFTNNKTNELLYYIKCDSIAKINNSIYICDAEKLDSTKSFFVTNNLKFKNGNTQSSEQSFKGKYSSKLTKENPYGMTCALSEVQNGEKFKISIWRYRNENVNSGLVVSANNGSLFYNYITSPIESSGNWEKLDYELSINDQLNNKDILIYCWNSDKILPSYFDNLTIEQK